MADYLYAEDVNIHTRFTELSGCTLGSIDKVLAKREGLMPKLSGEQFDWGAERHDMWAEESKRTKKVPSCFDSQFIMKLDYIEKEFATMILPKVIVHSRPDAVSIKDETIIDYKTLVADNLQEGVRKAVRTYTPARQLKFYAFQLGLHGIRIRKGIYFIEIWSKDYKEILGYHCLVLNFSFKEIASVLPWAKERIALLVSAVRAKELSA